MTWGLLPTGLNIPFLQDIKPELESEYIGILGSPLNLNEGSVLNTNIGISAERYAELWALVLAVHSSFNINTATDIALDGLAAGGGVARLSATATKVIASIEGINQTVIPVASQVSALGVSTLFSLTQEVLITNESCLAAKIEVSSLFVLDDYRIIINTSTFTVEPLDEDTESIIVNDFVDKINTANIGVVASNVDNILIIKAASLMTVFVGNGLTIASIITTGIFEAVNKGYIPLPATILTKINTPVQGWISVYNEFAGIAGRNLETDLELRLRYKQSLAIGGAGTVGALRSRLLNISGVTSVDIINNTSLVAVNGVPPKAFEALVLGGENQAIANVIEAAKPLGIESSGNEEVQVIGADNRTHTIRFSRPVSYYIFVRISYKKNETNDFPLDGETAIKNAIVEQLKNIKVGESVIYQALYKSVYGVSGIKEATITIGASLVENTPPVVFESVNIDVASPRIAVTDASKITFTVIA